MCSQSMASFLGFQFRPLPYCTCGPVHVGETVSSSRVTKPSWKDILSPNQHCLFAKRTPRVLRVYYKGGHWANALVKTTGILQKPLTESLLLSLQLSALFSLFSFREFFFSSDSLIPEIRQGRKATLFSKCITVQP